jgi:8-oxo-dGTP pyrophosphatase MutT (NUDIX family)
VINLATIDRRYSLEDEAGLVRSLGMLYHHIPVKWQEPTESDFLAFEEIVRQCTTGKILIHCAANFRVTAFYLLYAQKHLGWSEAQARDFRNSIWSGSDYPVWERFIQSMQAKITNRALRAWETLDRRTILTHNKYLTVENHIVKLPDGEIITDWAWISIPDAAIVLTRTEEGQFLCFRQTKYAVNGTTLAPVGGMLEPGETAIEAGKRELLEEMGYTAPDWISLGSYILDPNRGVASMHLFLALNARKVAEPNSDDLEEQEIITLSRKELEEALKAGNFKVLAWTAVVALSLNYLSAPVET